MLDVVVIVEIIELARETEPAMLDQIVKNFSVTAPILISEIKSGYERNDLDDVERAAHKMKGSASILGMLDLTQKTKEIMEAARKKQAVDSEKNVSELTTIFHANFSELNSFISQNRSKYHNHSS